MVAAALARTLHVVGHRLVVPEMSLVAMRVALDAATLGALASDYAVLTLRAHFVIAAPAALNRGDEDEG